MPFICPKCSHEFNTRIKLENHLGKRVPCISDTPIQGGIFCKFCNNSFSTKSNLKTHYDRCAVRKNPELLIKHIEKQEEILAQKDIIIEQKDIIIEQMKDTKAEINIGGNHNNVDQSIDNSTKNIDNSTTINNINNITLIEQPYAMRSKDMLALIENMKDNPETKNTFLSMRCVIMDNAKDGDIETSIETLMTTVHDNNEFSRGKNLRYCNSGIHKGKLLIYDYDENDKGCWYVADIEPVSQIISNEFKQFNDIHETINKYDKLNRIDPDTKSETKNMETHKRQTEMLHVNPKNRKCIFKIVKDFKISDDAIPSNISDVKFTKLRKHDNEASCRAKLDGVVDTELDKMKDNIKNAVKTKKIHENTQPSEADRIAKLERDNYRLEQEKARLENKKIEDAKYEKEIEEHSKQQIEIEGKEMDNFKPCFGDIVVIKDTKKINDDSSEKSTSDSSSDKKPKKSKKLNTKR